MAHFCFLLNNIRLYGYIAVYSPAEKYLGCFQALAVMNKIAGSSGKSTFNFVKKLPN
jgi:hypothetical protein